MEIKFSYYQIKIEKFPYMDIKYLLMDMLGLYGALLNHDVRPDKNMRK